MKYIGIVGTRQRDADEDLHLVRSAVLRIWSPNDVIVSGGCKHGGDRFAVIIARELGTNPLLFLPDKSKLDSKLMKENPSAAYAIINYARNTLIARQSNELVACIGSVRKGGTEDTIKKFEKFWNKKAILV